MKSVGTFQGTYTIDGETFFDTLAAMNVALEEERLKAEGGSKGGSSEDEVSWRSKKETHYKT